MSAPWTRTRGLHQQKVVPLNKCSGIKKKTNNKTDNILYNLTVLCQMITAHYFQFFFRNVSYSSDLLILETLTCNIANLTQLWSWKSECYEEKHPIFPQLVCDDNMVFIHVLAGRPGSVHDSRVMCNSELWRTAAHKFPGDTHLLGDGGYPLLR